MKPASKEITLFTREQQEFYRDRVAQLKDFNDAFELVKMAVEAKFKMHRAGISLVLQGLPTNLGAYHVLGSNMIIMNRRILNIIKARKSVEEYNSYSFMVLCHEYLHSFGVTNESQVRKMTYDLCLSLFGEDHLASLMARYGPWSVFPDLNLFQRYESEETFEIVRNFDKTTQSYIC
jgi:hypothetical protein